MHVQKVSLIFKELSILVLQMPQTQTYFMLIDRFHSFFPFSNRIHFPQWESLPQGPLAALLGG